MKMKLMDRAGNLLRDFTTQGGPEHASAPDAVVIDKGEGVISTFILTQRDDADGAQVYTQAASVLVLDR